MPTDLPRVPGQEALKQLLGRVTDTYNMLWKMVIRPPRDHYSLEELGPEKFRLGKRVFLRRDIQLRSSRGALECSHFIPAKSPEEKRACVVYLHGNCSSRLEVFDALPVLLPRNMTVFCLDLSGSGRSEGEFISLGHHEEKDLECVLRYLRSLESVSSVGLWGRSMGATTSILCAAQDRDLAACVLDSAFRDLRTVAVELVGRGSVPVPKCLLNWALEMVRREVASRADFDPLELMPIRCAPNATCPAMFGVASDDTFVLPHHTQDLHDAWGGEKELRVFDGGHNGVRPDWFLEEAADFLAKCFCKALKEPRGLKELSGQNAAEGSGRGPVEGAPAASRPAAALAAPVVRPSSCSTEVPAPCSEREADIAAGRPTLQAMLDGSIPRQKCEMAVQLTKMGFRLDSIVAAVREFSNSEDAVEWLQQQQPMQGAAPKLAKPVESRLAEQPSPPPAASDPAPSPKPRRRRAGPPGDRIVDQLQYLGFGEEESEKAARRCLSVEDAVKYLSSEQVVLHL